MTNPTSNFGWQMPTSTDLVTDLPADFETFGQAVDTSMADLKGGTTGQILSKTTNTDMDFTWITNDVGDITAVTAGTGISGGGTSGAVTVTNSMATTMTTKGDLVPATGSGTFARLAAGANGETLVADSSTSTGLRYQATTGNQNYLIGGGFDIWQRGTSFASPLGNTYTADRIAALGGGGTNTISQETSVIQDGSQYSLKVTAGSASAFYNLATVLESPMVASLTGKTVTYSIYVRANATYSGNVSMSIDTGTVANSLGGTWTTQASQSISPSTSAWTRLSVTYAVPSGTVALRVTFNQTSLQASGAITYWSQAKLEIGLVATAFTRAGGTIQGELAACQRYYFRNLPTGNSGHFGFGMASATTAARIGINCPVPLRAAASSVDFANVQIADGVTGYNLTGLTIAFISQQYLTVSTTVASGLTQYRPYYLVDAGSSTGYIGFSAEL